MGEPETGALAGNDNGTTARPTSESLRGLIRDAQISCACASVGFEVVLMRQDGTPSAEELERLKDTAASSIKALEALQRAIAEHLSRDA